MDDGGVWRIPQGDWARLPERAATINMVLDGWWVAYGEVQVLGSDDNPCIYAPHPLLRRLDRSKQQIWAETSRGGYVMPPDLEVLEEYRWNDDVIGEYHLPGDWLTGGLERAVERGEYYRPLGESGSLFLEFARLAEEQGDITAEVWLDWVSRYGVLGFERREAGGEWWGDPRGGAAETLGAFRQSALQARAILRAYEAATDPNGADVETLKNFLPKGSFRGKRVKDGSRRQRDVKFVENEALGAVRNQVASWLRAECYPRLVLQDGTFAPGWGFRSLLGAMGLQMYWLLTQTDATRRCEGPGCNHILYAEPSVGTFSIEPDRKQRKTRSDKRFHSRACARRWRKHYNRPIDEEPTDGRGHTPSGNKDRLARKGGRRPLIPESKRPALRRQLEENPAAGLEEQRRLWQEEAGTAVSAPTLSRAIQKLGWRRENSFWVEAI